MLGKKISFFIDNGIKNLYSFCEEKNEKKHYNYFLEAVMRQRCEITLFLFIIFILFFSNVFAGGGVYWQENGIQICSYGSNGPLNVFDGKRSAIIVWLDDRNIDADSDIYGQRVDIDGNFLWQANGVPVAITPGILDPPGGAISDGKGGAITAWADGRQWWVTGGDIYAQRIDSMGNRLWGSAGTAVCVADSEQMNLSMVSDGEGGTIIVWEDGRNGYNNMDIYAQRMDSGGLPKWEYNGMPVCSLYSAISTRPLIVKCGSNFIIGWDDIRDSKNSAVFAQKVNMSGNILWGLGGLQICPIDSIQGLIGIVTSGNGVIGVWNDNRNGNWDIYAQRIRSDGSITWSLSGVPVCTDSGCQVGGGTGTRYKLISDSQGGAIIMWDDRRNESHDIFMQRIDSLGQICWQENGVYVCTAADSLAECIFIKSVSDGRSGVILAWSPWDTPGETNIYAQRVDSLGVCQWDSNGLPVCTAPGLKRVTGICSDGEGGAIISWGDGHVCAQRVGDNPPGMKEYRDTRHKTRALKLLSCSPNPFTMKTVVRYQLSATSHVSLRIYDITGRLVKTLVDGFQSSRVYKVEWDGCNNNNCKVAAGVYFTRLTSGDFTSVKKVILVR